MITLIRKILHHTYLHLLLINITTLNDKTLRHVQLSFSVRLVI